MEENIFNNLKSRYEDKEVKPSMDLWDRLEEKLDNESSSTVEEIKPKIGLWKYAAAVAIFLSIGFVVYSLNNTSSRYLSKEKLASENNVSQENVKDTKDSFKSFDEREVLSQNEVEDKSKIITNNLFKTHQTNETQSSADIQSIDNIIPNTIEQELKVEPKQEVLAETKKSTSSYINANDLLLGRELDKTREEAQNVSRQFGVLDASKIRIKSINSFKILGISVISDTIK